jgi:RsiW-degrading membrane proteinase PrsW (M82 family)
MREVIRIAALGLLTGTLLVLAFHAPGAVFREIQFLAFVLLATIATRSMSAGSGLSALGLGLGVVVFLIIGAGRAMTAAGLDTTSGFTNWALIPVLEESLKLVPIGAVMWWHARRHQLAPNPSDLLMLGCFAGAGFALAENVTLVQNSAGAARDMARQYGPSLGAVYFVPGAWGAAGYVGHAAATGLIAGGYGLGLALRGRLGDRWWMVPGGCAAWILLEHVLTNYYVGSGSRVALLLGNGRLTPWLFVMLAAAIVTLDYRRRQATLVTSARLRVRTVITRAALLRTKPPVPRSRINAARLFMSQLRLVNAAAWFVRDHNAAAERTS